MTEAFGSVFWLLIALGLLITFHEYGHYWAARRFGVQVLRFSLGFGKPLWMRRDRAGTEWVVAPIPLGGYVRLLDDREVEVAPQDAGRSLNAKPVWQQMAVYAAGPIANLVLCVALLWAMFLLGKPDLAPQASVAGGIAASAGLREGDRFVRIGERATPTWTEAAAAMALAGIERVPLPARVRALDGSERDIVMPFDRLAEGTRPQDVPDALGVVPYLPARIGEVLPGSAADGRLQPGDLVLALDDRPVANQYALGQLLQTVAAPGTTVIVAVERDGQRVEVPVDPRLTEVSGGGKVWRLGTLSQGMTMDATLRYGPLEAVPQALKATWRLGSDTLLLLKQIVVGKASLENLSGPITMARAANASAGAGPAYFLNLLAALSLGLCIFNLLPIPVLDGGHLLYYLIELVKGSPVGENARVAGQYVGLAMLACLMGLAFYNDLFRPAF